MLKLHNIEVNLVPPTNQDNPFCVKIDGKEILGIADIVIRAGGGIGIPQVELTLYVKRVSGIIEGEPKGDP
jgi:hypothetical protein